MSHPSHAEAPAAAAADGPDATRVADILLHSLLVHGATAAWFEPVDEGKHTEAHRVTIERGRKVVATAVFGGGLGDAVIARLALIADLDLLAKKTRSGRFVVRVDGRSLDLLVTVRTTDRGLAGELRVLDDSGDDAGVSIARLPGDEDYPEILSPGITVGPYLVERVVGRGGMGIVYQVEHTLLRKTFAMKVLSREVLVDDADSARRFVREARAAARVRHDGIVDVSDFGSLSDGRHYLVMELLVGKSLETLILTQGAMAPVRCLELAHSIASALDAAHACGVIHRDLTPSNIFVDPDDQTRIKLVDFGAAAVPDPDQADVPDGPPGMVLGTPYYMSPEQAQGLVTDHRSDLYALGVILFELLAGRLPFDGGDVRDIVLKHVVEPAPAVESPFEILPEDLERLVARLLAKEPEDRYQSARDLLDDIDRVAVAMGRRGWRKWLPT